MKKIVTVVVVLVLLLVVAPWGVGRLAEQRLNQGLDRLLLEAPYLKVVERKWAGGWFKSEQVVTFEAFGNWMETFSQAMKQEESDADGAADPEGDADELPPEELPADAGPAPAKPVEPLRFTLRNEVLHGPVLGLSGFGVARVDSHLVLSDEIRKKIADTFGPENPLEVSTRVGFFGGGTTTFKSEGRTITPKDGKASVSWETFTLAIGYSGNADKYNMDGKWPKFEVKNPSDNTHLVIADMTLDGNGRQVRGDLYDGDFRFGIAEMRITGKDGEQIDLADLHYAVNTETKGDFTAVGVKFGSGVVKSKQLSTLGVDIKEIHYDLSVRHLHAETLVKMLADLKALYAKPLGDSAEAQKAIFTPLKEQGAELLKHDPELVLDRIGLATSDGDGYLKGVIALKGATLEDFAPGKMAIISKIHADLTIDVSEKMLQKFPNGSTMAGAAVDSGYAKREGDRLICKIGFADGQLTVNGKPQALPGLGGPPPGEGGEAVQPQE